MELPRNLKVLSAEEEQAVWDGGMRILDEVGFVAPHGIVKTALLTPSAILRV